MLFTLLASNPQSPKPERPKIFNKRQSLRQKRRVRVSLERPASDSSVPYASRSDSTSSLNGSGSTSTGTSIEYPEMPGDVPDWISRRREASRGPPRPMQALVSQEEQWNMPPAYEDDEDLYELDAGPAVASGANGSTVPRTLPPNDRREDYGEPAAAHSDEDPDLVRAIELSQQQEFPPPGRTNTDGFDEAQIAEAMSRSLHIA
jgi:hypothetical protein